MTKREAEVVEVIRQELIKQGSMYYYGDDRAMSMVGVDGDVDLVPIARSVLEFLQASE